MHLRRRNIGDKYRVECNATKRRIMEIIKTDNTITTEELAEKINITPRSIERNIKQIKALGFIDRKGGDRGGFWGMINNHS